MSLIGFRKMGKKIILYFLNLLLFLVAVGLYIITFFDRSLMRPFFSYGAYYLILLLVLFWIITLLQCLSQYKPNLKSFIKSYGLGLVVSLLLTSLIFTSVQPIFRVLSDETNLLAVSKSMTYEKRIDNVTMGKWYYDNFYPIRRVTPKRPLLFPFFTHILHILLGYRTENAFILNFLVLFSLFFLIYVIIKKYLGNMWAFSATLLVASQPIVSQTATCGGFDLLSVLFFLVCFLCLWWFLKEPSAIRFQLLWVNLLMYANIRHESILAFLIMLCLLACLKYIKIGFFKTKMNFLYFCTPLIFLCLYWQRLLIKNPFETQKAAFSVSYFVKNNLIFLRTFFNYDFFLPYATFINFVGFLSLLYFGYLFLSAHIAREKYQRHSILITAACLFANWTMYTSYHMGKVDHASASRYYVVFCVLLSVLALIIANHFRIFRQKPVSILALSILMFMIYHPVSVEDRFSRTQTLPREYRFVMNFLKEESKKNRNFLVITKRPGQYTVHNYGAVNFNYANTNKSVVKDYNRHLYENIFVIQDIEYKTSKVTKGTRLNKKFVLEKLVESQNKSVWFTRISKVVSVHNRTPE